MEIVISDAQEVLHFICLFFIRIRKCIAVQSVTLGLREKGFSFIDIFFFMVNDALSSQNFGTCSQFAMPQFHRDFFARQLLQCFDCIVLQAFAVLLESLFCVNAYGMYKKNCL